MQLRARRELRSFFNHTSGTTSAFLLRYIYFVMRSLSNELVLFLPLSAPGASTITTSTSSHPPLRSELRSSSNATTDPAAPTSLGSALCSFHLRGLRHELGNPRGIRSGVPEAITAHAEKRRGEEKQFITLWSVPASHCTTSVDAIKLTEKSDPGFLRARSSSTSGRKVCSGRRQCICRGYLRGTPLPTVTHLTRSCVPQCLISSFFFPANSIDSPTVWRAQGDPPARRPRRRLRTRRARGRDRAGTRRASCDHPRGRPRHRRGRRGNPGHAQCEQAAPPVGA